MENTKSKNLSVFELLVDGFLFTDSVLCGGVPKGTLFAVEDSSKHGPSETFARCFLSYGAHKGDRLLVSDKLKAQSFPKCKILERQSGSNSKMSAQDRGDAEFQIAWRYSGVNQTSDSEEKIAYDFDNQFYLDEQVKCLLLIESRFES